MSGDQVGRSHRAAMRLAHRLGFEWGDGSLDDFFGKLFTGGVNYEMEPDSLLPFGLFGTTDWDGWPAILLAARGTLDEIEHEIRSNGDLLGRDRHRLHDMLWQRRNEWREFRESAWQHGDEEANEAYNRAHRAVDAADAGGPVRDARVALIEEQRLVRALYMHNSHRKQILGWLAEQWQRLDHIAKARHDAWGQKQDERQQRHREWRERQQQGLSRLEDALDRVQSRRDRVLDNLAANQDRLGSARSDSYAERVRGWVEQDEEALEALNQSVRDLREKIADAHNRLREP